MPIHGPQDNPQLKPLADLLSLTGVTADTLRLAVKGGFVPAPEKGKYRLASALVGLIKFLNTRQGEAGEFPIHDSMNQCAARSGIPLSVLKRAKKSGCDAFKWNRVDCGKLVRWLFANTKEEDWRGHFDKYHALREELRHSHEAGETLAKAEVSFAVSKAVSLFFNLVDRQANIELPALIKGRSERECQTVLLSAGERLKLALKDGLGGVGEEWKLTSSRSLR